MPVLPAGSWTKTCLKLGMTRLAVTPTMSSFDGTSRQPRTANPSSRAIDSTCSWDCRANAASRGRKHRPTPYAPACGRSKSTTSRRKRSGTWTRMPAPSPELVSAPCAPRWSRLQRAPKAVSTMLRDLRPLMSTTNDTPHASCSNRGSYRPAASGRLLNGSREYSDTSFAFVISPLARSGSVWAQRDDVGPAAERQHTRFWCLNSKGEFEVRDDC